MHVQVALDTVYIKLALLLSVETPFCWVWHNMVNVHNVHVWSPYIGLALMESPLWFHTISIMYVACFLTFTMSLITVFVLWGGTVEGNTWFAVKTLKGHYDTKSVYTDKVFFQNSFHSFCSKGLISTLLMVHSTGSYCAPTQFASMRNLLEIWAKETWPQTNNHLPLEQPEEPCDLDSVRSQLHSQLEGESASEHSELECCALNEWDECVLSIRFLSAECKLHCESDQSNVPLRPKFIIEILALVRQCSSWILKHFLVLGSFWHIKSSWNLRSSVFGSFRIVRIHW